MEQFLLFLYCFAAGVIIAVLYKIETVLIIKTDIFFVTVVLDFLLGLGAVFAVTFISSLNDGIIRPYFICAEILGGAVTIALLKKIRSAKNKRASRRAVQKNNIRMQKKRPNTLKDFLNSNE